MRSRSVNTGRADASLRAPAQAKDRINHASRKIFPSTEVRHLGPRQILTSLESLQWIIFSVSERYPDKAHYTVRTPKNSPSRNRTDPMNTRNPKIPLLSLCIAKPNSER